MKTPCNRSFLLSPSKFSIAHQCQEKVIFLPKFQNSKISNSLFCHSPTRLIYTAVISSSIFLDVGYPLGRISRCARVKDPSWLSLSWIHPIFIFAYLRILNKRRDNEPRSRSVVRTSNASNTSSTRVPSLGSKSTDSILEPADFGSHFESRPHSGGQTKNTPLWGNFVKLIIKSQISLLTDFADGTVRSFYDVRLIIYF